MMEGLSGGVVVESEQPHYLNIEKVSQLLIHSFRLSQGDPKLQAYIFQYLHLKYPDWKIKEDQIDLILDHAMPIIERVVFKKKADYSEEKAPYQQHTLKRKQRYMPGRDDPDLTDDDLLTTATDELVVMSDILNGKDRNPVIKEEIRKQSGIISNRNINFSLFMMRELIQQRDELFRERGREMSFYEHYVLNKHSTGVAEYDQMMEDVRSQPWVQKKKMMT